MTKNDAKEILCYVAQEILSPMIADNRPASEVFEELIRDPFNKLCGLVMKKVEK